jgi:carbon-monoxide dehydrogenase medium subunit
MIPTKFAYAAPSSLDDAVELLARDPDGSCVLGGGTWVVPDLNLGRLRHRQVIDLRRAGLAEIRVERESVIVGSMSTYGQLIASSAVTEHVPLLALMAAGITGGGQITGQGTVGGSAVAARPQSDVPATLVALRAHAILGGPEGERRVSARELFAGAMKSALRSDELLVRLEVDSQRGALVGYAKLKRGASSWPIATAAVVATRDDTGHCSAATLVLGGVAAVPIDVDLSQTLIGRMPSPDAIDAAAQQAAAQVIDPWGDVLAPASYRLAVARPIAKRALAMAFAGQNEARVR